VLRLPVNQTPDVGSLLSQLKAQLSQLGLQS
jgi:hypothetical protein